MKKWVPKLLAIVCVLGWSTTAHATEAFFDFDSLPSIETGTDYAPGSLMLTNNNITATFLSDVTVLQNNDGGGQKFPFIPTGHLNVLNNTVVYSDPTIVTPADSITVQFSQSPSNTPAFFNSVSLNFATGDTDGTLTPLTLFAYSGGTSGTLVGTQTYTGTSPSGGGLPWGSLYFSSALPFDTLVLNDSASNTGYVYIDSIALPETSSWVGFAMGFLVLFFLWRQCRNRTVA